MEIDASYDSEDCFSTTKCKGLLRLNCHKDKKCNSNFQEDLLNIQQAQMGFLQNKQNKVRTAYNVVIPVSKN